MIDGVPAAGTGALPVLLVLLAAVVVAARTCRRDRPTATASPAVTPRPTPPGPMALPHVRYVRKCHRAGAGRGFGRRGHGLGRRKHGLGRAGRRGPALGVVTALVAGSMLLGSPATAQPFDCKESPEPDRPGTGLVGSLDAPTLSAGEPGSVYNEVGYAGLIWHNYDLGCAGSAVFNPATSTDTWLGNQTFNVAKFVVGGVNWAHYLIADGGELLAPLDALITDATRAMYDAVFTTWIGLVLLILAVLLFLLGLRGDLARQAQKAGFAAAALMVGSAAYLAPVDWAQAADGLLLDGVTDMQEGFLDQVGLGDRDTLPTVLVDQVVYQNWLRGEFGASDVPQAEELGRDLLRAQTFTKAEVLDGEATTERAEEKKEEFAAIAERVGDRYPYFTGEAGSRTGIGILAVVQAVCVALFQLLAKVLVLVAMLLLRLMVMAAPALAVVAVLKSDLLPALLRIAGAAIVNTLIVGAMAGLHALLVVTLFRPESGIDLWLALLVTGVVTVVLWAVARPFRRLVSMVSLTREQFGGIVPGAGTGPMGRVWQRFRGAPDTDDRQARWWDERRSDADTAGYGEGHRPEARTAARRPAQPHAQPRPALEPSPSPVLVPAARRPALPPGPRPAGAPGGGIPSWSDPGEVDERVIYRRPDAVPMRPGSVRPVQPELVDGVPVYRIYRPRTARPAYTGNGRAD